MIERKKVKFREISIGRHNNVSELFNGPSQLICVNCELTVNYSGAKHFFCLFFGNGLVGKLIFMIIR